MTDVTLDDAADGMFDRLARTAAENANGFPHVVDATTGVRTRTPGGDWTGVSAAPTLLGSAVAARVRSAGR